MGTYGVSIWDGNIWKYFYPDLEHYHLYQLELLRQFRNLLFLVIFLNFLFQ